MQVQVHVMDCDGLPLVRVDLAETAMQTSFVLTPEDATSLAGLLSDAAVTPVTEPATPDPENCQDAELPEAAAEIGS